MARQQKRTPWNPKQVQEFSALLGRERREPHGRDTLRDIEEALERIKDGTYGICMGTGKRIKKRRLMAIPWTKYSIEYAKIMEKGVEYSNPQDAYLEDLDGPYAA